MPKRNWKKAWNKTIPKSILTSILTSQNLPKSLQNQPGTRKNGMSNEACFAKPCASPAPRPKPAGLGALELSPWSFKGLGLLCLSVSLSLCLSVSLSLCLSVSLSLCWSAPRRPNHRSKFLNIEFLSKCLRLSFASVFCLMLFTPRVLNRHISTPGDPKNHQIRSPKAQNS